MSQQYYSWQTTNISLTKSRNSEIFSKRISSLQNQNFQNSIIVEVRLSKGSSALGANFRAKR
jgi:hypothetical protein